MIKLFEKIKNNQELWFIVAVDILVAVYLIDTLRASMETLNLILVLPVSIGIVLLSSVIVFLKLSKARSISNAVLNMNGSDNSATYRSMIVFTIYILSLNWLGFDVGTSLYLAVSMWMQGVRKMLVVLPLSLVLGFCLAAFFKYMLPYPMPMLLL